MPIQVYLTAWYYPIRMPTDENRSNDAPGSPIGRNPPGVYNPNSPAAALSRRRVAPDVGPISSVSDVRVLMKKVESTRGSDGSVVLTSSHVNLKLEKTTTYVLATGDLMPAK